MPAFEFDEIKAIPNGNNKGVLLAVFNASKEIAQGFNWAPTFTRPIDENNLAMAFAGEALGELVKKLASEGNRSKLASLLNEDPVHVRNAVQVATIEMLQKQSKILNEEITFNSISPYVMRPAGRAALTP